MAPDIPFAADGRTTIATSRTEAIRTGCDFIDSDHLLLGILRQEEGRGATILRERIADPEELIAAIDRKYQEQAIDTSGIGNVPLTIEAENIVKGAVEECRGVSGTEIGSEHILLALLHNDDSRARRTLEGFNIRYDDVLKQLRNDGDR